MDAWKMCKFYFLIQLSLFDFIGRIAKRKPNKHSILSQLQKKEQNKDLALSYLGKEIDIYLPTGKLYVKSPNSDSLLVNEKVDTTTKISQSYDNLIYDSDDPQASLMKVKIKRTRVDSQNWDRG